MLIKLAIGTVPPVTVTAARVAIGALILRWCSSPPAGALRGIRSSGACIPFRTFRIRLAVHADFVGRERIDSGPAAILMAGMPLVTILLARFVVGDEPLPVNKIVGVLCGVVGLVVLIGPARACDSRRQQRARDRGGACVVLLRGERDRREAHRRPETLTRLRRRS